MLSLDIRHKTHNIPGKFLSYIASGLPVLASVNPGNDLIDLIEKSNTGRVISDANVSNFAIEAQALLDSLAEFDISSNCKKLSNDDFQPLQAVKQIIKSIENH